MKKLLTIIIVIGWVGLSSSTIINIPADYPTIQQGIDASTNGDTVLVQPGLYIENVDFSGRNIVLGSLFLTTGDDSYIATTIIDGDSSGSVVTFDNNEDSTAILKGFTITRGNTPEGGGIFCMYSNPVITNNIITLNMAYNYGAGIYCYYANPIISYNDINSNTLIEHFGRGGGIYCGMSAPLVKNNLVYNNSSAGMGGGISCANGDPVLINNAFYGNVAGGGGGIYCWLANPTIRNCIFWDDLPSEILMAGSSYPDIAYSDIEGNWPGIGNIDIFPLFRDPANDDFHLMYADCGDPLDSPCIDVGDPTIEDYFLSCNWGLGTVVSDMGAYGGGDSTLLDVDDVIPPLPEEIVLLQNYPNPFNAATNIEFILSGRSYLSITIYNILGQEVANLYSGIKPPGVHTLTWNAGDYPSGVYFARLEAGNITKSMKMILLK
ncbi:MAG: T9SS type A sorting domain-containing protein [Candidatus Zixiibacteriota bacterium]|nr:MAG: T9SS type A sorting domain-containing protein [candidate division Zixibacteria bacterium]